jgi:hypothetical protein
VIVGDSDRFGEEGSVAALINVLALPLYLRDIVFLGRIDRDSDLNGVTAGGVLALAAFVVVLAVGIGTLVHRYRWVER